MTNIFKDAKNLDELRKAYREAALRYHPDRGGDTKKMQDVNAAYKLATERLTSKSGWDSNAQHGKEWSEGRQSYYADLSEKLREVLYKLLAIDGIEIEITGYWFWITHPDSRSIKEQLKEIGCRWHSKKKRWYYPGVKSKGRGKKSMSEIREDYGSAHVKGGESKQALNA